MNDYMHSSFFIFCMIGIVNFFACSFSSTLKQTTGTEIELKQGKIYFVKGQNAMTAAI